MDKQILSKTTVISRFEVEEFHFDVEKEMLKDTRELLLSEIKGRKVISGVDYWGSFSDIQEQITYWNSSVVVSN